MQEQTSWSSSVVDYYFTSEAQTPNLCRGFTLFVHVLSVDEHRHGPARMHDSKFVHCVQNYRQTPHRCCCLLTAKIPRRLSILSNVPFDQRSR